MAGIDDLSSYLPVLQDNLARDDLIECYFHLGFSYAEIILFLVVKHSIGLSSRQLKRILKNRGIARRRNQSNAAEVLEALQKELAGSGSSIGYRAMHQRLCNYYRLVVSRENVRKLLRIIDPEGVDARLRHRLRRRKYAARGPNYLWHIDGYDKLKPFGFAIHGCIDGYTRKILWLEVGPSNNNPDVICSYYLGYVEKYGSTAYLIRADKGSENVSVAAVQRFFRRHDNDAFSAEKSFMYGKSVGNQRIEAWWSVLRKGCTNWWMNYFKDMRDIGIYNDSNPIHVECLKFCYFNLIQKELHKVAILWNLHNIRPCPNSESPSGRPDTLYHVPEITGTFNFGIAVNLDELDAAKQIFMTERPEYGCSIEFSQLALMIMEEDNLHHPNDTKEAEMLYLNLINHINNTNM